MVKRGSSNFSATSVGKGSVVLSRVIEKNFALEAEVSQLQHHVSILSRRLHFVTIERDRLRDTVNSTVEIEDWGAEPRMDKGVAEEESGDGATPSVAGMSTDNGHDVAKESASEATPYVAEMSIEGSHSVADEVEDEDELAAADEDELAAADEFVPVMAVDVNRFQVDLIEEADSVLDPLIPSQMVGLVRRRDEELAREGGWPTLGSPRTIKTRELGSSGDEDAVLGGVIVAGGASQKAKNTARWGKRKNRRSEASGWGGIGKLILFWACVTGQPDYGLGMSASILHMVVFGGG